MAGSGCSSSSGDSDVSSSAPSSSCSDDCGDSPRPAADSPPCRPPVRRVPSLSLRANLVDLPRGDAPLTAARTARPQQAAPAPAAAAAQVPPPAQQTAAAAPPRLPPLALGGLPPRRVDLQPSSQTPTALNVDVLSPAFNLQRQQQQDGEISQLALTCAGRLGVQPERLRFYALTEVSGPQQLPSGCSRAAVEVVDSRFSLAALEELVADNHRLAAAGQERGGQQQAAAQVQALQLENDSLRAQLELSEALRRKGARSLQELVQEFNALSRELMKGSTSLDSHMMQAPPHDYARIKAGTPVAVVDGLMLHNGSCDG